MINGKDLIQWGLKPGKWFPQAIAAANAVMAAGGDQVDAVLAARACEPAAKNLAPLREAGIPYAEFIDLAGTGTGEERNLASVRRHMDELMRVPTITAGAIMPDACPAGSAPGTIPVGGAVSAENAIHPGFHSADICCSVAISVLGRDADPKSVLDALQAVTHFGPSGRNDPIRPPSGFADLSDNPFLNGLEKHALHHFATQGDGNHFAYVGRLRSSGRIAIVTHHGSRGLGAQLYKRGMAEAVRQTSEIADVPSHNAWIVADTREGALYWAALQKVRTWTRESHYAIHDMAVAASGAKVGDRFWNEHNFCIPGDQRVATTLGPVRMDEIKAGDYVYSLDPQKGPVATRVKAQWHSGKKALYKIETLNRSIRVSGEHPIQVIEVSVGKSDKNPWMKKFNGALAWKQAKDLSKGDVIVCVDGIAPTQGEPWSLAIARFVGAYLGDGWHRSAKADKPTGGWHTVGLAIGGPDDSHTARYKSLLEEIFPDAKWRNNGKGAFGLTATSKAAWTFLEGMDLHGCSKTRALPKEAFTQPMAQRLEILAGYVDADGTVMPSNVTNGGQCKITAANEGLVKDLRELAISCGMRATKVRRVEAETNFGHSIAWTCMIGAAGIATLDLWHEAKRGNGRHSGEQSKGLRALHYGNLQLPEGSFAQRVRSVSIEAEEDVYDIEVEHDTHSFVCEGIVVHNCFQKADGLFYHGKGATPSWSGFSADDIGLTLIPLNCSEPILVTRHGNRPDALGFAPHGAGRNFSRGQHLKLWSEKVYGRDGEPDRISHGLLENELHELKERGLDIRSFSGVPDLSELPSAYKSAKDVRAQIEKYRLAEVVDAVEPYGSIMAGEFDKPWLRKKQKGLVPDAIAPEETVE